MDKLNRTMIALFVTALLHLLLPDSVSAEEIKLTTIVAPASTTVYYNYNATERTLTLTSGATTYDTSQALTISVKANAYYRVSFSGAGAVGSSDKWVWVYIAETTYNGEKQACYPDLLWGSTTTSWQSVVFINGIYRARNDGYLIFRPAAYANGPTTLDLTMTTICVEQINFQSVAS